MVPNYHAHLVTPARQRPSQQCLLDTFTGDIVLPIFGCQDRQIFKPDEADFIAKIVAPLEDGTTLGYAAALVHSAHDVKSAFGGLYVQPFLRPIERADDLQFHLVAQGAFAVRRRMQAYLP